VHLRLHKVQIIYIHSTVPGHGSFLQYISTSTTWIHTKVQFSGTAKTSFADPHQVGDADPDAEPPFHFDADQDPDPTFYFDTDLDPASHQSVANLRSMAYRPSTPPF
jgi:hypothetical protein